MPWIIQLIVYREVKFLQFQGQKFAEAREAMGLIINNNQTDAMERHKLCVSESITALLVKPLKNDKYV